MPTPNETPANGQDAMQERPPFEAFPEVFHGIFQLATWLWQGQRPVELSQDDCQKVLAHVRKLAEDAERLDWLNVNSVTHHIVRPLDDDTDRRSLHWLSGAPHDSASRDIRAAIDAARRTTP